MQVSTSGCYEWRHHHERANERDLNEAYLVNEIPAIDDHLDDSYGSPRLTHELRRTHRVNHKRVERIVREYGLYAIDARRKKLRTTIPDLWAPRYRTGCNATFRSASRDDARAGTSPIFALTKAGSTSRACSTSVRVVSWVTPWMATCAPSWSRKHSPWRSPSAAVTLRGWSFITTEGVKVNLRIPANPHTCFGVFVQ